MIYLFLDATIYVGGLDEKVNESLLWELFVQGGPVVNVHMPKDRVSMLHQVIDSTTLPIQMLVVYSKHPNTEHLNTRFLWIPDILVSSIQMFYHMTWQIIRMPDILGHNQAFFSLVSRPPFEYRTIWQPNTNLRFKYQSSPVFRWLLYAPFDNRFIMWMPDKSCIQIPQFNYISQKIKIFSEIWKVGFLVVLLFL